MEILDEQILARSAKRNSKRGNKTAIEKHLEETIASIYWPEKECHFLIFLKNLRIHLLCFGKRQPSATHAKYDFLWSSRLKGKRLSPGIL